MSNSNDEIIGLLAEIHADVQSIKSRVAAVEDSLRKMSSGLAVVVSHDQEHKKKSAVWPTSLAKKLYPDYQE